MKVEMDVERRARHRDKTDVFAEDSQALDQIAKQVRIVLVGSGLVDTKERNLSINHDLRPVPSPPVGPLSVNSISHAWI